MRVQQLSIVCVHGLWGWCEVPAKLVSLCWDRGSTCVARSFSCDQEAASAANMLKSRLGWNKNSDGSPTAAPNRTHAPIAMDPLPATPLFMPLNSKYPGLKKVHEKPPIFVVENFLTSDECEAFIQTAGPLLQRSKTHAIAGVCCPSLPPLHPPALPWRSLAQRRQACALLPLRHRPLGSRLT